MGGLRRRAHRRRDAARSAAPAPVAAPLAPGLARRLATWDCGACRAWRWRCCCHATRCSATRCTCAPSASWLRARPWRRHDAARLRRDVGARPPQAVVGFARAPRNPGAHRAPAPGYRGRATARRSSRGSCSSRGRILSAQTDFHASGVDDARPCALQEQGILTILGDRVADDGCEDGAARRASRWPTLRHREDRLMWRARGG